MPFNLRVTFSGLCAFVPNQPIAAAAPANVKPTRMDVVMVDARTWGKAVDTSDLKPHFPIAVIDAGNLLSSNGVPPGRLEWRLDRRELSFDVQSSAANDFVLAQGAFSNGPLAPGMKAVPTPLRQDDFGWGVHMQVPAPTFAKIDPACWKGPESKGLVAARAVIDRGRLATRGFTSATSAWYFFDPTLGGGAWPARPYSNSTTLELQGLTGAALVAKDLDGLQAPLRVGLTGRDGEWVEITVSNMDDGRLPEHLPNQGQAPPVIPPEDIDFKWFYSLCANRGALQAALKGNMLPAPKHQGGGGPGVVQCFHAIFDS